ncbi:Acyl-CoA dehydrogenase [bacterium HR19]|nr:Acyl-CoA dehydrogenase [bacterium HR19]
MFDFSLNEQQDLLVKTVEEFARKEIREKIRDFEEKGVDELRKKVFEIGLSGVEFPEEFGGAGMGMLERALVLKTMAEKGDGGTTYSVFSFLPPLYALYELSDTEKTKEIIKKALQGKERIALAKSGIYQDSVTTRAKIDKNLTTLVVEEENPSIIVFFGEENGKISLYISRKFKRGKKLFRSGVFSSPAYEFNIEEYDKVAENFVRTEKWARFIARVHIMLSAICAGIAKCASDYALEYALERVAFGRPIAYHQAISFMLADMDTTSDALEILLLKSAWDFDKSKEYWQDSTTELILESLDIGKKVTSDAVQVLGGHGYIKDHPVEKWMRDFEDIINAFGSPIRFEGTIKNLQTGF